MMKVAAMFGTEGGVSFSADRFDNALTRIGDNTGNMLFQYAMWRLVAGPKFCVGPGVMPPEAVKRTADVLVIPAANQINPRFNLEPWAAYVEAVDLPSVVVGLGAQADDVSMQAEDVKLPEPVIRFAKAISAKTSSIGVRGEFTQKVLETVGVTNTVVTGCPSLTINSRVTGRDIARALDRAMTIQEPSIALLGGTLQEYTRGVEAALYRAVQRVRKHIVVYQTERRLLRFIHNTALPEDARSFISWMNKVVRPDLDLPKFFHYLAIHGRCYSDARSWIDAMCRVDVAIGMRIHGAIAAVQAGRAGVCVAFDSRTLELSQTIGIPYVLATDIEGEQTLQDILAKVRFDPDEFDEKRARNSAAIHRLVSEAN